MAYRVRASARFPVASILGVSTVAALAGCMAAPEFPRRVSVAEVVHNARCELYAAVQERQVAYPWLKEWAAGFDFSFVVDRDANANTDTTYLLPVHFGTNAFGLKANLKQKAKGTYTVGYKILKGLGKGSEAHCGSDYSAGFASRRLLSGEIGLRQWINDVVPQLADAQIQNETKKERKEREDKDLDPPRRATGEVSGVGYTIEFGVTADGTLLPSWALTYPDKRQFKPGFGFTLSEAVTHKLVVAMTPLSTDGSSAPDKSGILGFARDESGNVIKGKDGKPKMVIVARRFCAIDRVGSGQCSDESEAKLVKEVEAAKQDKNAAAARSKNQYFLVQQGLPKELKGLPPSQLANLPTEAIVKRAQEKNRQTVMQVVPDIERFVDAYNDRIMAEQRYQEKMGELQEFRAAVRTTETRARAEVENDASRRLDQLIQQQLLRDALRP